jgi:hypothetical protein
MRSHSVTLVLTLFGVLPVAAQSISITPFIGKTIPTRSALIDTSGLAGMGPKAHTLYGLRLVREFSPRFSLDLSTAVGHGEFSVLVGQAASSVLMADLRGRLRVVGRDSDNTTQLSLLLGGGYTRYNNGYYRYAADYQYFEGEGTWTGVGGLHLAVRRPHFGTIELEVVDRVHASGINVLDTLSPKLPHRTQHDLTVAVGYKLPI